MAPKNDALAKAGSNDVALARPDWLDAEVSAADQKAMRDEALEGLKVGFPRLSILPAGACMFETPDAKKVDEVQGVILFRHACNALWRVKPSKANSIDEDRKPLFNDLIAENEEEVVPFCESKDAKMGSQPRDEMGRFGPCSTCAFNQFGSDPTGRDGKACKNMDRQFIAVEGELVPWQLTAPPTSIRPIGQYVQRVVGKGMPLHSVVTALTLVKETAGSNAWSVLQARTARVLTHEEFKNVSDLRGKVLDYARSAEITTADYKVETPPAA